MAKRKVGKYPVKDAQGNPLKNVRGGIYQVLLLPSSKPGLEVDLAPGSINPPVGFDFKSWFQHYVKAIGVRLEELNANQLDYDPSNPAAREKGFVKAIEELRDVLKVGSKVGNITNPAELTWPLAGYHEFAVKYFARSPKRGNKDKYWVIKAAFDCDMEHNFVINCGIIMEEVEEGGLQLGRRLAMAAPMSSSSYLMTSSSSRGGR